MISQKNRVFALSALVLSICSFGSAFFFDIAEAKVGKSEIAVVEDERSNMRNQCRLRFAYNNLSVVRDLGRHQPRQFYDPSTFERQDILRPSSYAILANPEKFEGKVVAFVGYLKRSNHCCCPMPGDECYHLFITRDDYRNASEANLADNYVHLRVNSHFVAGNNFPDGSLIEGLGLLKAGKVVSAQDSRGADSASTLLNGSMCLQRVFDPETLAKNKKSIAEYQAKRRKGIDPWNSFMSWPSDRPLSYLTWEIRAGKIVEGADKVEASGGVLVSIDDQDAELTADSVVYEKTAKILRTIGNVKIVRRGQLTTGQRFDFKVASDEYLVTETNVKLGEPLLKVRTETMNGF